MLIAKVLYHMKNHTTHIGQLLQAVLANVSLNALGAYQYVCNLLTTLDIYGQSIQDYNNGLLVRIPPGSP